jgi:Prokaryotic N-terminal methylation motif
MTRRSGATLLEVLVAIFVMGIGMLALLTLFPLGALRMAKAIQDQRCAETAANASSVWTMNSIYNDPGLTSAFKNPGVAGVKDSGPDGPSYPVLVDPIGSRTANGTLFQTVVGGNFGNNYIGRTSVGFVGIQKDAYQWFTLLDDIDFESATAVPAGNPLPGTPRWLAPPAQVFTRDIRYSYAFMCQRPRQADASVVDTAVVVYNKRPLSGIGGLSLPEYAYNKSTFDPGNNTITIDYSAPGVPPPPVRVGDWILDGSPVTSAGGNVVSAHAYFYRIVGSSELPGGRLELEVETPLRGFTAPTVGTAIILDGVAEVFTKGTARLP